MVCGGRFSQRPRHDEFDADAFADFAVDRKIGAGGLGFWQRPPNSREIGEGTVIDLGEPLAQDVRGHSVSLIAKLVFDSVRELDQLQDECR